ncbi:hypothetical protein DMA12_36065 [Amycolatopsis balhimycina DSM 5908]|uniref:Uncharacterized protein n=1 Tax=Amycolatopsis balhimycina DSM 5908 TaxID=1081091 RepID=A0A428W3K2_AMYBA|nr:hypothetical protein [Amycolatopsis balhimycina]RSM37649.1 hypothetical protein DMA12_36065 [Amycolatopsis balhimycina DSM 5908]
MLRDTPSLVPNAVNEVVRLESPLRAFGRIVESDTTLSGTRIPAGARMLGLGAMPPTRQCLAGTIEQVWVKAAA